MLDKLQKSGQNACNAFSLYSPSTTSPPALQRLRGWEEVDEELSEIRLENESEKAEGQLSVFSLLSQPSLRWQLTSVIVLNMGQQLSGVNAVRLSRPQQTTTSV